MAVFSPTILVNTTPPLVVTIADPGSPGVTYQQFQNSLGQYVYLVQGFYVFIVIISFSGNSKSGANLSFLPRSS